MTYRNEGEALRARVDQLEDELASAQDRIAKLSGEASSETVRRELRESKIVSAPIGATLSQTFPYELDAEGYGAIAALIRERMKVEVSQVGHSLTTPGDVFALRREDGQTVISLKKDWAAPLPALISVGTIAALLGGFPIVGVLHDVGMHHPAASMLHALWLVPGLVGAAAWVARRGIQKQCETGIANHTGTFEAVLALAEKHAVKRQPVRARVVTEEGVDHEAEREAEEPAARAGSRSSG